MNEQEEKIKHYEILAQGYNQDMLHSVLDFSKMGLKAAFILNGSADISVLTLFTKALIYLPEVSSSILNAVYYFALGALFSALAVVTAYFTQLCYQKSCAHNVANPVNVAIFEKVECDLSKKVKENIFLPETYLEYIKGVEEQKKQIIEAFNQNKQIGNKSDKIALRWRNSALVLIALSFAAFFWGIYTTKNAFNNIQVTKEQISFSDLSYPNVQIKTILPTKP